MFSAEEGVKIGFVNKVVSHDTLLTECIVYADRLCLLCSHALATTKQMMTDLAVRDHFRMGSAMQALLLQTQEHKHLTEAFLNRAKLKL